MRLEFAEPKELCEVLVGYFSYDTPDGGHVDDAEFYVRTCVDDQDQRVSDLNEQYTDEFFRLENQGNTNIRYKEITPSPVF